MMDQSSSASVDAPQIGGVTSLCVLDGAISADDTVVPNLTNLGLQLNFVR